METVQEPERPQVLVKPDRYQPTKAETEEDVSIDTVSEDAVRAAFPQVKVVEDPRSE